MADNNVIPLADRAGTHLATIEIWRLPPHGLITGKLIYMPGHVIEHQASTGEGLRQLAEWTHQVADVFQQAAAGVEEPQR